MTKFRLIILITLAVFSLILGALSAAPIYKKEYAKVEIGGVSLMAEIASDPLSRSLGLSRRYSLSKFGGMLFTFEKPGRYGIWMKEMKFPLDVFWIRKGRVVDLEENLAVEAPGRTDSLFTVYYPDAEADFILETRAGLARKYNVRIGDEVKIFLPGGGVEETAIHLKQGLPQNPPGHEYFIETLRRKPPEGKDFRIEKVLEVNSVYQKFLISYRSGNLKISGVMNVPRSPVPEGGFPVLILNHGLIPPEIYFPGRGSRREQDFFTRRGYITIHPDYRGHASSSPNPINHHDFYVGYSEDVVNLIDALKKLNSQLLDIKRLGMWGHSMGGGIAARVMVLRPEIRAYILFAPISAEVSDNFFELKKEEIARLGEIYGFGKAAQQIYDKISPLNYFIDVESPVQIHHGAADRDVPPEFSDKIFRALSALNKKVELYKYPGEGHEFDSLWSMAAERALQFFDRYVKNIR